MLCYRCGSHVPDASETCPACGEPLGDPTNPGRTNTHAGRRKAAPAAEGAPFRPGDVIGRYQVVELIGTGPVGSVFKARDPELDLTVAVKVINPRLVQDDEERAQLARVIKQARKLTHQNLARVNDEGEHAGQPFVVTAFLEGMSLRKIIEVRAAKGQAFTLAEVEPIVAQVASALTSAHKHGPHADLKPENVLIQPDLLKVTDFGLGSAFPRAPFVQAQKVRRVERYLPPEFIGGATPDVRTDVYALGVILGEMLTGLGPADGALEALGKRSDLPPALCGLYARATHASSTARFSSPSELSTDLQLLLRKHKAEARLERKPEPAPAPEPAAERTLPPTAAPALEALFDRSRTSPAQEPLPPPVPTPALPLPVPARAGADKRPGTTEGKRETGEPRAVQVPASRPEPKSAPSQQSREPARDPRPPPDATQPLDLSQLPFLLGQSKPSAEDLPRSPTPPPDATQPIDLDLLAKLIGPPPPAPTRTLRAQQPPPKAAPPERPAAPVDATQPLEALLKQLPPRRTDETMPLDVSQLPLARNLPPVDDRSESSSTAAMSQPMVGPTMTAPFASSRAQPSLRSNATLLLAGLTVTGLVLGVAGGSWLLDRIRRSPGDSQGAGAAGASRCGPSMELIAAGPFEMGTAKSDPMMGFDERALGQVEVPAFCVDRYEYPNKQGEKPKVNVSWTEAESLCQAQGKRLCSEQEWEKACKGPQSLRFPYGNTYDAKACNTEDAQGEDREIAGAGSFPLCRSEAGVMDLSGNVAEWTATAYGNSADKAQKGGSSDRPDYAARCSARRNGAPASRSAVVGFRCCQDAP